MKRREILQGALALAASSRAVALAQAPALRLGELKPLAPDRFQIGRIEVDKRAGKFSVPGRVHLLDKPLEYLATTPGGMKAYETLLEVDATGTEFNLACILLGLERDTKQGPFQQFGQARVVGPRVLINVAWVDGGKRRQLSAAEALLSSDAVLRPETVEWVYTGSPAPRSDGAFGADIAGTLIGCVHDPNTIIESAEGIGIGAYGSVRGNAALPAAGSAIELIVETVRAGK